MPFPPKPEPGAEPPDFKAATKKLLGDAASSGKLKPVEDFIKNEGIDFSAAELVAEAAKMPALEGKDPAELARTLADDSQILDDLITRLEMAGGGESEEEDKSEYAGMDINGAMDKMRSKMPTEDTSLED